MAGFLFLLLFFAAGSAFGPVQYHPTTPADYHAASHEGSEH
jgi:hypothetical protein